MLSIIVLFAGISLAIYGVLILARVVKVSENSATTRYYAASKAISGGIAGIVLGICLYLADK